MTKRFIPERPMNPPDIPIPKVCKECTEDVCDTVNCKKLFDYEEELREEHKIQKQIEADQEECEKNTQLCMEAYGLPYEDARKWAEDEEAENL